MVVKKDGFKIINRIVHTLEDLSYELEANHNVRDEYTDRVGALHDLYNECKFGKEDFWDCMETAVDTWRKDLITPG